MTGAQIAGVPLRLRVMIFNTSALRLYGRLGFVAAATHDVDIEMVWAPSCPTSPSAISAYPDRLRLPAAAIAADVASLDDRHWIAHYVPDHYDGDWSVLPLRAKAGAMHPIMTIVADPAGRDVVDTPLLDACPAIRAALSAFRCPLLTVRLMRLAPGASIKEHVDPDLSFEQGHVRLHVPVATNDEVDVRLNGSRVIMKAGTVWYLRLSDPHSVANRGTTARVHLVIDAAVNPWLEAIFAAALAEA